MIIVRTGIVLGMLLVCSVRATNAYKTEKTPCSRISTVLAIYDDLLNRPQAKFGIPWDIQNKMRGERNQIVADKERLCSKNRYEGGSAYWLQRSAFAPVCDKLARSKFDETRKWYHRAQMNNELTEIKDRAPYSLDISELSKNQLEHVELGAIVDEARVRNIEITQDILNYLKESQSTDQESSKSYRYLCRGIYFGMRAHLVTQSDTQLKQDIQFIREEIYKETVNKQ